MTPFPQYTPCPCGAEGQKLVDDVLTCASCGKALAKLQGPPDPPDTFRGYTVDLESSENSGPFESHS